MTPRRLIEPARLAGSALLHTQSDERLVDLARAGNDRAFEAIVGRYRRPLLRYCTKLLPPERAEDAVQQAFLNAYRAIGAGEAELKLRPWLYRIAHNASLSLLRQNGWNHEEIDDQFDGVQQPPQAVEERERVREVVAAVQGLPERQRDAMVLRELEGRSYEEIAAELGVTGGAVRQLLNRARTTLRSAATALTPVQLVEWIAARGPAAAPAADRMADLCAGGAAGLGGLAGAAKLGTALVVAGAVVGGGAGVGPLPSVVGGGEDRGADEAVASEPSSGTAGAGGSGGGAGGGPNGNGTTLGDDELERERGRSGRRDGDDRDTSGSGDGEPEEREDSRGPGSGGDDDSSGPGSGDDSSGSGSSGSGPSGSGSSGSGSSGSGSGDSGSGSSGSSGSSASGSSGSDSSGSGSSGGDSSSSGSGSGSSGSGSDSSGSGSGSGSSGSGSGD